MAPRELEEVLEVATWERYLPGESVIEEGAVEELASGEDDRRDLVTTSRAQIRRIDRWLRSFLALGAEEVAERLREQLAPVRVGLVHGRMRADAREAEMARFRDGEIDVLNKCRKGELDGPEDVAEGRARVVDRETNAKLEVSFFGPFWGDYWIIDLGPNYEYAVVGHPSRDYLWILSRTPTLEPNPYDGILSRLEAMGYPLEPLEKTLQNSPSPG